MSDALPGGASGEAAAYAPRTADHAAAVLEQLARAVEYAHRQGIPHRDLKPQNVLIVTYGATGPDAGTAKLADFGLVGAGKGAGSPAYLAPEVAATLLAQLSGSRSGVETDRAAAEGGCRPAEYVPVDVYGLGAILHEVLTGRPPHTAETVRELLAAIADPDDRPGLATGPRSRVGPIPRTLRAICLKCLAKDARGRYPSASALAADLRRFREARSTTAYPSHRLIRPVWRAGLWCR